MPRCISSWLTARPTATHHMSEQDHGRPQRKCLSKQPTHTYKNSPYNATKVLKKFTNNSVGARNNAERANSFKIIPQAHHIVRPHLSTSSRQHSKPVHNYRAHPKGDSEVHTRMIHCVHARDRKATARKTTSLSSEGWRLWARYPQNPRNTAKQKSGWSACMLTWCNSGNQRASDHVKVLHLIWVLEKKPTLDPPSSSPRVFQQTKGEICPIQANMN